jgi:hypothetical protein
MVKPQIIPRIVIVGLIVMIFGAVLAAVAYVYETGVLGSTSDHPLFDLFADGFKVGLGAFIGVLSQWASRVFADVEEAQKGHRRVAQSDASEDAESVEFG